MALDNHSLKSTRTRKASSLFGSSHQTSCTRSLKGLMVLYSLTLDIIKLSMLLQVLVSPFTFQGQQESTHGVSNRPHLAPLRINARVLPRLWCTRPPRCHPAPVGYAENNLEPVLWHPMESPRTHRSEGAGGRGPGLSGGLRRHRPVRSAWRKRIT